MPVVADPILRVEYPDNGWAFNPIKVSCSATSQIRVEMEFTRQDGATVASAERQTFFYNINDYRVNFDMQGLARDMFSRSQFWVTPYVDTELRQILVMRAYRYDAAGTRIQVGPNIQFPVIWGALQPGKEYKHYIKLTYFRGMPFTFPVLTNGDSTGANLYQYRREDEGGYAELGPIAPGKYNIPVNSTTAERRIVNRFDKALSAWGGIFDITFDHTFRGLSDSTFFVYLDVMPCRTDGVYLRWIGRQGEWFYYNFKVLSRTYATNNREPFIEQFYDTIDVGPNVPTAEYRNYHPGTGYPVGKNEQETVQLSAPLVDSDHYDYIEQVIGSPRVDMLIDGTGGDVASATWVRVGTQAGNAVRSNDVLQDFTFNMLMPVTQNQYS